MKMIDQKLDRKINSGFHCLFYKFSVVFLFLVFYFLFSTISANAASMYFSPSAGSYEVGKTFSVNVYVSSADQAMNAASSIISFPADKLEVISLSKTDSIFTLWAQEPSFSNSAGTINFEGIMFNPGFKGLIGKLLTINFRVKASGSVLLSFLSGSVLANDGQGTNILTSFDNTQVNLGDGSAGSNQSIVGQGVSAQTLIVTAAEKKLTTTIDANLVKRLAGRILLQTETLGQAWYLDPVSLKAYYLADGQTAYSALRKFGLGIKNSDIIKIPVGLESRFTMTDSDNDGLPDKLEEALGTNPNKADTDGDSFLDGDEVKNGYNPNGPGQYSFLKSLVDRLKGRIVIQTESRGEAWYINPVDGKRYYLANGEAAYQIMRYLSLGISNKDFHKIPVGDWK